MRVICCYHLEEVTITKTANVLSTFLLMSELISSSQPFYEGALLLSPFKR